MPDELCRFQTTGPSWSERASAGELRAVLSPGGSDQYNHYLHACSSVAARKAARLIPKHGFVVDFGCGTGRFLRLFHQYGLKVLGLDITAEMIDAAKSYGVPDGTMVALSDGIKIPKDDSSVDLVWVCGVLRYSLLVPDPVYADIAREMYRVLKPGGHVVNVEMYIDKQPDIFTRDFESVGFTTEYVRVINRYRALPEQWLKKKILPLALVRAGATALAHYRYLCDSPSRDPVGLVDYVFDWKKPT